MLFRVSHSQLPVSSRSCAWKLKTTICLRWLVQDPDEPQLANTLGPELVSKLSSAIQAMRDRTTDPGGRDKVFSHDALHKFMVIFKHTRTNMEIWLRAVAEVSSLQPVE